MWKGGELINRMQFKNRSCMKAAQKNMSPELDLILVRRSKKNRLVQESQEQRGQNVQAANKKLTFRQIHVYVQIIKKMAAVKKISEEKTANESGEVL